MCLKWCARHQIIDVDFTNNFHLSENYWWTLLTDHRLIQFIRRTTWMTVSNLVAVLPIVRQKCEPHSGTRGKSQWVTKVIGFILSLDICTESFMAIHPQIHIITCSVIALNMATVFYFESSPCAQSWFCENSLDSLILHMCVHPWLKIVPPKNTRFIPVWVKFVSQLFEEIKQPI